MSSHSSPAPVKTDRTVRIQKTNQVKVDLSSINQSINQSTESSTMKVYAWLIDLIHRRKHCPTGMISGWVHTVTEQRGTIQYIKKNFKKKIKNKKIFQDKIVNKNQKFVWNGKLNNRFFHDRARASSPPSSRTLSRPSLRGYRCGTGFPTKYCINQTKKNISFFWNMRVDHFFPCFLFQRATLVRRWTWKVFFCTWPGTL